MIEKTIPFRNKMVVLFATEWCAYEIIRFIATLSESSSTPDSTLP